jgi:TRAP-type C4-dicarboxylate transport system permease small subunit
VLKRFIRLELGFSKFLESATSLILILLTLVVIYNAMARFLPIDPTQMAWTEEIGRLLLLWLGFVGAGLITREEKHFVIDLFTRQMGGRTRLLWQLLGDVLTIAFLAILIRETIPVVIDQMGQITSGAVEMPLGFFSLSLLVGIFIMIFYVIKNLARHFRNLRENLTPNN